MLKDVMTDLGFWNDDAQVVKEHVEKLWCDEPTGIDIEIIELPKIKEG
jgi:Holliday junction resolvase RusA-like endonuclease